MTRSSMTSNAGRKMTTNVKANNVPRPSKIPMDDMIGSDDVNHKMNPTLESIDAGTAIEKTFSLMVFSIASIALISFRLFVKSSEKRIA